MKPEHHQPSACNLVIFGITGDLARRKLLGALYHLDKENLLHPDTRLLGLAHSELSLDDFRNMVMNALVQFVGSNLDQTVLRRLMQRFGYHSLQKNPRSTFSNLGFLKTINQVCSILRPRPRCSVPSVRGWLQPNSSHLRVRSSWKSRSART
jgi:glucose-6-phosphate 1-dehydrogenase